MNNPFAPPQASVADIDTAPENFVYVGFWRRVAASILPLLTVIYGWGYWTGDDDAIVGSLVQNPADFVVSYVLPAIAVIVFWRLLQATPGKMAVSAKVVDADTGRALSWGQSAGRYFAYIPLLNQDLPSWWS